MSKKYFLILFGILVTGIGSAQEKQSKKIKFHSINSVVLVNGNNAVSAALQTVNGIQKGNWFAGAGLGLDYYLYRTVPVFIDLRYEMGKNKNRYFIYGDAGMHFEWVHDYFYENPSIWNGSRDNEYSNGFYTDAGIGIMAGLKKGNAFVISLGHSKKLMKEKIRYPDWRTGESQTDIHTYRLNRILLKLGYRF